MDKDDFSHDIVIQLPARMDEKAVVRIGADEGLPAEHADLCRFLRARLLSQEVAEEVAREAIKLVLRLNPQPGIEERRAYFFRAANDIATCRLRTIPAEIIKLVSINGPDDLCAPVKVARERLDRVKDALQRLPPLCQRAFILVRYEGLSFHDAAAQMGLNPRKVRRLVRRAFEICQRALGE